MLHIEISGDSSRREWQALAAVAAIMLDNTDDVAKPFVPSVPIPTAVAVAAVPAAPATLGGPDAPKPPIEGDPAFNMAEQLMAAEEARVAGVPQPPAAVVPPPPGVELDTEGLPHDLRIHSPEKTKNKDGTWRVRRKTDPALLAAVKAELKSVMAAPAGNATAVVPPPPSDAVQLDPAAAFGGNASVPVAPSAATPITTEPPAANGATLSEDLAEFARVMRTVVAKQKAGVLTTEATAQIAASLGLTGVKDLSKRPDLIAAFEALLP